LSDPPIVLLAGSLFEVPLREGAAGAGLQVALETDGPPLIRELDDDVKVPRSTARCVSTPTRIVIGQSGVYVGREADIEVTRFGLVPQDVDESLLSRHRPWLGKRDAWHAAR
jgi:hypothetical protein